MSPENSPFKGLTNQEKVNLINELLVHWHWLDQLCASYTFLENNAGQQADKRRIEDIKNNTSNPYHKVFKDTPLSIGLWVVSGLLSE